MRLSALALAGCLAGGAGLLAGCDRSAAAPLALEFDGAASFRYVERQLAFGPRVPGTEGHARMAAWLDSTLRARADTVVVQRWTHVTAQGDSLPMVNLLARFKPAAEERILYLAHWDTRPVSDQALDEARRRLPVPGANDGASGVAVLLGVADLLRAAPPEIGVDLLFVDGEDYGAFDQKHDVLIGSRYYAANQPPGPPPMFAVLWDMVADADLRIYQEANSLLGAPDVVRFVWETAHQLGYGQYFVAEAKHEIIDDHIPLQQAGIRAIDVLDFDYPYWHTPDDTIDKVSPQSLQVVGNVAAAVIRRAGGR